MNNSHNSSKPEHNYSGELTFMHPDYYDVRDHTKTTSFLSLGRRQALGTVGEVDLAPSFPELPKHDSGWHETSLIIENLIT